MDALTSDEMLCPNCGSDKVTEIVETSTFNYGVDESVAIQVTQPVVTCGTCGESFTDYRGEEARTEAVERYRRVMSAPIQARLDAAEKELRGYAAWERSVNEALNSGDGSYRP